MLKRLKLGNFKSWPEADLAFGRITGLFGANSSGKSSLLQFLLLLKQTKDSRDRAAALDLNGRFVELGTPADVIHGHDEDRALRFRLDFESESDVEVATPGDGTIASSRVLAVRAEADIHEQAFRSRVLVYRVYRVSTARGRYARFALEREKDSPTEFKLTAQVPGPDFSFTRTRERVWKLPGPVKTYRFPDEARTYFQNSGFLLDLEAAFEAALDKLHYLGPLREHPKRDYLWTRSRPTDVGERGERTIDAIIAAIIAEQDSGEMQNLGWKQRRRPFSYIVAHWLRELGLVHDFRVEEIAPGSNRWQACVKTRAGGIEVMLTDVGFGVSRVLPAVTLLHYVPEGSTVLLEQPEIHLHPLAQAGLADAILHAATHRKVQVVFESHSEHLLLRLQRRIAEKRIDADDVALYFCGATGGASRIESLALDEYGNVRNWPDGFMGDAFGETAQAERARLARMKSAAE